MTHILFCLKDSCRVFLSWMGQDTRSNFGLDHRILLKILRSMDKELKGLRTDLDQKRYLIMTEAYFIISFVCSLRGNGLC